MQGARDYVLRELRTAWWLDEVEEVEEVDSDEWPGAGQEELRPPRLPWNAHVVHHQEMLFGWRARNMDILPLIDLEVLAMTGKVGPEQDRAWDRYLRRLKALMQGSLPGRAERVVCFEVGPTGVGEPSPGGAADPEICHASLYRDAWHWGVGLDDEEPVVLPPQLGAELAWRLSACVTARHRAALADDLVMLAQAMRHVPDPRTPFVVLVHGRCLLRARWRLGEWEWSASYAATVGSGGSEGYWRRGEFGSFLRSDLLHLGVPSYLHPAVAHRARDAFRLALARRGEPGPEDSTWEALLDWAEEGQVVDCLVRGDLAFGRRSSW